MKRFKPKQYKMIRRTFIGTQILIVYLILMTITSGAHSIILPCMLVITFVLAYINFKKNKHMQNFKLGLLFALPFPIILFTTCLLVADFSRGLPYIVFIPLFSFLGFLYLKKQQLMVLIFSTVLVGFISYYLFPAYFIYYHNHDAEKNILYSEITLLNKEKEKVELDNDKIIVLDFWTTSCGICFKKFPELEQIYQKFKLNKRVEIYTVNVPIKKDKFEKTIKILDSIGYEFPKLYAQSANQVETNLKFNTYPHLIILKKGKIRYDGFLITENSSKKYNIENQINKLLNE